MTDSELIDYTLKFDTDPVRVRLAGVMDRMPGSLIDTLVFAGMDPETWLFENTFDAGNYVRHLESEIEYLGRENFELQQKLTELEARTVAQLIAKLNYDLKTMQERVEYAEKDAKRSRDQLLVWNALKGKGV